MSPEWVLDAKQVEERMLSYEETEVTDGLYEFGKLLLAANRERTNSLENKAMIVAGYGLAILAFLLSKEPSQSVIGQWPPGWLMAASVLAALALACVGAALFVRSQAWFSEGQWFENEKGVLLDPDYLKRCHVIAMHAVNQEMRRTNDHKANIVVVAQALLLGAGICSAIWILFR